MSTESINNRRLIFKTGQAAVTQDGFNIGFFKNFYIEKNKNTFYFLHIINITKTFFVLCVTEQLKRTRRIDAFLF